MKILLLLISLIVALTSFSQNKNPDWNFAGEDAAGNKRFIKCSTEYKKGNLIKIWFKDLNKEVDSLSNRQYIPFFFVEVDCVSNTMKLLTSSVINLKGDVIFEYPDNEPEEKVIPGSMKELTLRKTCEFYRK